MLSAEVEEALIELEAAEEQLQQHWLSWYVQMFGQHLYGDSTAVSAVFVHLVNHARNGRTSCGPACPDGPDFRPGTAGRADGRELSRVRMNPSAVVEAALDILRSRRCDPDAEDDDAS
jgi:hypothetical protein